MKKALLLAATLVLTSTTVFAMGEHNDKNSCVITYGKGEYTTPNLTIACDGEALLHVKVAPFQKGVQNDLYLTFQNMVNSDGAKKCAQYDQENVWWATCLR